MGLLHEDCPIDGLVRVDRLLRHCVSGLRPNIHKPPTQYSQRIILFSLRLLVSLRVSLRANYARGNVGCDHNR